MSGECLDYAKIDILIARAVPEEARREGGEVYKVCLREVWDMALRIGINCRDDTIARARQEGFEEGKAAGLESGAANATIAAAWEASNTAALLENRHKRELEEERIWGYDVGWTLARDFERSNEARTSFDNPSPIPPSPRCLSSIATQTDMPALGPPLNWVKDTQPIPAQFPSFPFASLAGGSTVLRTFSPSPARDPSPCYVVHSSSSAPSLQRDASATCPEPPSTPPSNIPLRDFSALRSETSHPFKSLQRRHCRSSRTTRPRQSTRTMHQAHHKMIVLHIYDSRSEKPDPVAYDQPPAVPPSFPCPPPSATHNTLDWDRDPRLRELSRALTALGWVPPS
ncbi:hypothetical protein C8R43DRAFT_948582 [Mycena crocata]|nr:hypothetical protein C8R43DRAFT_948582 [Mycena crocata]